MALYYFHYVDGGDMLLDPEGRDLPSLGAAAAAALRDARSIIGEGALKGHIALDQRIEIEDAAGEIVHRLEFADAVTIVPGDRISG